MIARYVIPVKPVEFARLKGPASDYKRTTAGWMWIERPANQKARLVRVDGGQTRDLAAADAITSFDSDGKTTVWIARDGNTWLIQLEGSQAPLFRGPSEPKGLCIAGGRLYWTLPTRSVVPGNVYSPGLAPKLTVISQEISGGAPFVVAELLESDGTPLGVRGNDLYVQAFRPGYPGSTVIYQIPSKGGAAERIVGESQRYRALLTSDGDLYWPAESLNASNPISVSQIRRLKPGGRPETVIDWVHSRGRIYQTDKGVLYIDNGYQYSTWAVESTKDGMPRQIRIPAGYISVALGGSEALLMPSSAVRGPMVLYKIAL
jgi:hypothetical protein